MNRLASKTSAAGKTKIVPVIRDKEFAKRLLTACESHPLCPTVGRGKQKWLRELLEERFKTKLSPEAVRKYFAGETRPKPDLMSKIAQILEVDEGWLSLGIKPDMTPREKKSHNATANGAVNVVAGLIQMAGGTVAFNEPEEEQYGDIFAIIAGKRKSLLIRLATEKEDGSLHVDVPPRFEDKTVLVAVKTKPPTHLRVLKLSTEILQSRGQLRGGFWSINIVRQADKFLAGDDRVPEIYDFKSLEPAITTMREKAKRALDMSDN